jgi:hypothetical protein
MTPRSLPDERANTSRGPTTMLFAVRLWREEVGGASEYRGSAREVVSGAFCSFRDWSDLVAFMVARLEEREAGAFGAASSQPGITVERRV